MIRNVLKIPIRYLDHFFVWVYGSKLNPLQRSGALTVGLLISVIVSGTYLIFFYSVSTPYESMQEIQEQWYLGRWIRSFHRYASDAAVIVVIYHSLSMLVQGRSWGGRTLAWISGIGLMCALFISGWTGFVMVWDLHGQEIAQEGARLFQLVPFLKEDLRASFSGENPIPGSFFFMNLFLHVAVPLGMVFGLWIHTSKMGNIKIFPNKTVLKLVLGSLFILSVVWPAPLLDKGDLSQIIHTIPYDIWFSFFLPISKNLSPEASVAVVSIGLLIMLTAVYWSSPKMTWKKLWSPHLPPFNKFRPLVGVRSFIVSILLLMTIAYGSQIPMNMNSVKALIRFNIQLPNLIRGNCHQPTAEERAGKLSHMQALKICDETMLSHHVQIIIQDEVVFKSIISESRKELRNSRTYSDQPVEPGAVHVMVSILTKDPEGKIIEEHHLNETFEVPMGKIHLVHFNEVFK